MTNDVYQNKIKHYIMQMPSLPTSVTKVIEVCNNPKTSPVDLDKVISLDPVLMGRVIKLINSAYYGIQNKITSLVRAIIMLGLNTVKNLALSTAVLDRLSDKNSFKALNMEGFWRHSLCTGVVAKLIAKERKIDTKQLDEYFAAGLLHDIGKIPLNNIVSDEFIKAMAIADSEKIPLYLAEKRAFDMDHTDTGAMIVEAWHLTGAIADTIRYHHSLELYSGEYKDIIITVAVADNYANKNGIGFSGCLYPEKIPNEYWDYLKISKEWLHEIDETVRSEIEKASIFLKIKE